MNGIYGWFGTLPEPETAQHVLDGMLAAAVPVNPVPASDRLVSTFRSADLCAGVTGRAGSVLISGDGDIAVVLSEITPIGDAAAVAAAYRRDGESFLDALRGRFALALLHRRRGHFMLAIDRAGARPLYVRQRGGNVSGTWRQLRGEPVPT